MRKLVAVLAIGCAGIGAYAAPAAEDTAAGDEEAGRWFILHVGTLIAEPGKTPARQQSVIVRNDRIFAVRDGFVSADSLSVLPADPGLVQVIDLRGSYVLPGLIDAHVHLDAVDESPYYAEEATAEAYSVLDVIKSSEKTLSAGFTTVRDMGSYSSAVIAVAEAISLGEVRGPRIVFAGNPIYVGSAASPSTCHDPASCRGAALAQIERGAKWLKVYGTCSGFQACGGPDGKGLFFPEELRAIVETARRYDVDVGMHAHANGGVLDALNTGVRSIEHGTFSDERSRRLFRKLGAYLVPTLSVLDELAGPESDLLERPPDELDPRERVMRQALEEHPRRVGLAVESGIRIGVGSDAGVTPHGDNGNELVWLVRVGMTPAQALRAATVVNAELLRLSDDIGTIEANKYADLVAFEQNPLDDIEAVRSPSFVMANGHVAYDGGQ